MNNTEDTVHTTADELRSLLAEAEKVLANAGGEADDKVADLRDRLRAALDKGRSRYDRIREQTREQIDHCDEYVRTHPYQAVGIAAAVGALAALLVARRA